MGAPREAPKPASSPQPQSLGLQERPGEGWGTLLLGAPTGSHRHTCGMMAIGSGPNSSTGSWGQQCVLTPPIAPSSFSRAQLPVMRAKCCSLQGIHSLLGSSFSLVGTAHVEVPAVWERGSEGQACVCRVWNRVRTTLHAMRPQTPRPQLSSTEKASTSF